MRSGAASLTWGDLSSRPCSWCVYVCMIVRLYVCVRLVCDCSNVQLGKRDYVTGRMWKHAKGPYRLILNTAARKQINWHCEHYAARGRALAWLLWVACSCWRGCRTFHAGLQ